MQLFQLYRREAGLIQNLVKVRVQDSLRLVQQHTLATVLFAKACHTNSVEFESRPQRLYKNIRFRQQPELFVFLPRSALKAIVVSNKRFLMKQPRKEVCELWDRVQKQSLFVVSYARNTHPAALGDLLLTERE